MSGYSTALLDQHAGMLAASGITPDHAHARGYMSVDTKVRLGQVGITPAGRRVPGLLVPQLRVDGSTWGYQYRPDNPRERDGKPVKYETPVGQRNGIDVPPGVAEHLADPTVPLWVTEGVKKADAGALAGLCIVALPGVWSWRGGNDKGGRVAVPDWHDVALNGRRVVLAFDSDVTRKRSVRQALDALAGYLSSKGASVEFCHLPDDDPGKTGLDDYLADGHTVEALLALVRPEPPAVVDVEPVEPVQPDEPVTREGQGTGALPDPGPPETGQVLGDVREWLARFVCTLDDADLDVLVLWAAHAHLVFETYTTPRLLLDSPVPGSGKTTVIEHLERLTPKAVQMAAVGSSALLVRMLDAERRTLLIDEADRVLDPKREGVNELLAVLNTGYKRGGTKPTLVPVKDGGWAAKEMTTFAAVVLAGNNPALPEDTRSRCIRVLLMPDNNGVVEDSDWEEFDAEARALGARLARWADQVRDHVRTHKPELPEGIRGRGRERWGPLKRVALAAGGHWPGVVDEMALHDLAQQQMDREDGMITTRPHVALTAHLHQLWPEGEPFVPTADLIVLLVQHYPELWGAESTYGRVLTAQRLGRMLATGYKVNSTRMSNTGPRGYTRMSLERAWSRMGVGREPDDSPPSQGTGSSGSTGSTGSHATPTPARTGFTPPSGPGRCPTCGHHIETQGHRVGCPGRSTA